MKKVKKKNAQKALNIDTSLAKIESRIFDLERNFFELNQNLKTYLNDIAKKTQVSELLALNHGLAMKYYQLLDKLKKIEGKKNGTRK